MSEQIQDVKQQVTDKHPHAASAVGLTPFVVLCLWLLGRNGVSIGAEGAAALTGAATATFIVVNERGLKGCFEWFWRGNKKK